MNHSIHVTGIDRPLPPLGVGAMPFSFVGADVTQAAVVWREAFDAGLNLINTADAYAPSAAEFGHNERLVGEVVRDYGRDKVSVISKVGLIREGVEWFRDNSPTYLMRAAEASNERLGCVPDGLLIHRFNRTQPFDESIRGIVDVKNAGLALSVGISNVSAAELQRAWDVSEGQIAFVENERSPRYRDHEDVLRLCTELGIVYLAWSPLGGADDASRLGEIYPAFQSVADRHGATAQQVALSWLRQQSPYMLPIPAFTRLATLNSTIASLNVVLSEQDMAELSASPAGPGPLFAD